MNRGGGSNGGGGGGGSGSSNPTPPSAYGHYQSYMSPYSSGVSPGGLPYQAPPGSAGNSGPPDQFGTNFNVQGGGGYYSQPSPNEDQGGNSGGPNFYGGGGPHPPGSAGSPGSRDLSFYGFNNGFGNGGGDGGGGNGGSAFYQQHQTQQDNNNKVSNLPGDTASVHEFGDTIKKEQHEQAVADLKQEQPQQDQSSVTSEAASGGPGGPPAGPKSEPGGGLQPLNSNDGPQNSDMNNSDNQTSRSQQSTPQDNRNISPKTMNPGSLKRSPASHESSEFEQQFEQSMAAAAAMPHGSDEYMRQMAMGNQSTEPGKLTTTQPFRISSSSTFFCYLC